MPTPIYHENPLHSWSSHPSSHFSQNAVQSPSRCPSLMSSATLSSRNSSTRSTRSLESIGRHLNRYSKTETEDIFAIDIGEHSPTQSTRFTAQAVELCPWKGCERHLRGFTKAGDRERHLLVHCEMTLVCGFCEPSTCHPVVFGEGPDRVSRFLKHLKCYHYADLSYPLTQYSRMDHAYTYLAQCPICKTHLTAESMYEHLPDCVGHEVTRMADSSVRIHRASDDVQCNTSIDITTRRETLVSKHGEGRPSVHDAQNESDEQPEPTNPECGDIAELTTSSSRLSLVSSRTTTSSEEETECSEEMSSRENSPAISKVHSQMVPAKRRLVDAIMEEFQKVFSATLRNHATNGTNPSSNGNAAGDSTGTSTYSETSFVSRKRSLSGGGSTPPDDGDDSNKRRRPDSVSKGKQPVSELRFACPYYKRNPGRHQTFTSCRDPGFTTVARLK
ncbi:hypothetical protein IG631_00991 [Alternaria alternata]|nr:hypothetical protein IG631_00991 [Alternaria alternata]